MTPALLVVVVLALAGAAAVVLVLYARRTRKRPGPGSTLLRPEPETASWPEAAPPLEPEARPDPERATEPDSDPRARREPPRVTKPEPQQGTPAAGMPEAARDAEPAREPVRGDLWTGILRCPPMPLDLLTLGDLGVAPAALPDADADLPYVARDVDAILDGALAAGSISHPGDLVVLRGGPATGLTRCAVECIRRTGAHRPVLAVASPAALPSNWEEAEPFAALVARLVDDRVPAPRAAVVLLDGAEEHLSRGLTYQNAVRLLQALPEATLVLTVNTDRLEVTELVADPTEAWLRAASAQHEVRPQLTDDELARAAAILPPVAHAPRLRGLPRWASAAEHLRQRYVEGRTTEPVGAAIVAAAVGWRQAVLRAIVPAVALPQLATVILRRRGIDTHVTDAAFAAGLSWATADVTPGRSLLEPVPGDEHGYRAAGVMVTEIGAVDAPVDADFVAAALDHLAGVEALDVGRCAAASGQPDVAGRALREAERSGDLHISALAALQLGVLEEQCGRPVEAETAYRRAATSGHGDHAPLAAFHLGGLLEQQQRTDEAVAAYRQAIGSGHAEAAPRAAFNLGWLLQHEKRNDEAFDAYETALTSGHADAAPQAAFNLGWLYEQQRRLREAEAVYREALASNHPDIAPMAAVSLGILLERMQRRREARDLFRRAADSAHDEAAQAARVRLRASRGR